MMRTLFKSACLMALTGYGWAQVTGTLVNQSGDPMNGCRVFTLNSSDTTISANGAFSFTPAAAQQFPIESYQVTLQKNKLNFTFKTHGSVILSINDLSGKLIAEKVLSNLKPGRYSYPISEMAPGPSSGDVWIIKWSHGTQQKVFKWIPGLSSHESGQAVPSASSRNSLKKTTSMADTLVAYCAGHVPRRFPLTGTPQDLGEIEVERFNVLMIAVDDLNDWTGYLGGHPQAQTPNIDRLAASGVAFLNGQAPSVACGPVRTALFYGLAPYTSGSYGHDGGYDPTTLIDASIEPLTVKLQQAGYNVRGGGKLYHWGESRHELYTARKGSSFQGLDTADPDYQESAESAFSSWKWGPSKPEDEDKGAVDLANWAITQLEGTYNEPFFIAAGFNKPHLAWVAPKKYFDRFPLDEVQLPPGAVDGDLDDLSATGQEYAHKRVGWGQGDDHEYIVSSGRWKAGVRAYLATITHVDNEIGRILDALEGSQYKDNTILILWGDHGWHLGEKESWRKMTLWERGTKTPFIMTVPGMTPVGQASSKPVTLQDIYPTLVELCGLTDVHELDGNNITPLLWNPDLYWDHKPAIITQGPGAFAVRSEKWRMIHYATDEHELYDMENDPWELTNLAGDAAYAETLDHLKTFLPEEYVYLITGRFSGFDHLYPEP